MVPFAVDPGRTALVIVDMQIVVVADSPVAGGVINDGAPPPRCTRSWTSARMTLSSASPGFGSFHGTGLEALRGIDTIIRGGINTNVFVDTTVREAAEHEFRDCGSARGRAARGACRRPGTGMARPPV